jgi:hypothetical protein
MQEFKDIDAPKIMLRVNGPDNDFLNSQDNVRFEEEYRESISSIIFGKARNKNITEGKFNIS